jgi:hypothetical protein
MTTRCPQRIAEHPRAGASGRGGEATRWLIGLFVAVVAPGVMASCGRFGFATVTDANPLPAVVDLDLSRCPLPAVVTVARSTPATYLGPSGTFVIAAPDQPRCAFDPAGHPRALLVERERTNYMRNTIGLGVGVDGLPAGWASQHESAVIASGTVSPSSLVEGQNEVAIEIVNTSAGPRYYQVMFDVNVPEGGGPFTLSWFVRADDPAGLDSGCELFAAYWTAGFAMFLGDEPRLRNLILDHAWQRLSAVLRPPPTTAVIQPFIGCGPAGNASYTLELTAPQLELGTYATTPIATDLGAIATRAGDVVTIDGAAWMAAGAGTVLLDLDLDVDVGQVRDVLVVLDPDGISLHRLAVTLGAWALALPDGDRFMVDDPAPAGARRVAIRTGPRSALAVGGVLATGAPSLLPSGGALTIAALDGTVARVRYWPHGLEDDELVLLSQP